MFVFGDCTPLSALRGRRAMDEALNAQRWAYQLGVTAGSIFTAHILKGGILECGSSEPPVTALMDKFPPQ
jgi:hypothetical protein